MKNEMTEQVERAVVRVEVSDEYRVEVWQRKRLTDYSPDEADELSNMLREHANEARAMMRLHLAEAAARTVAGALGSDLVPDGQSEPTGTENPGDGRTAAAVMADLRAEALGSADAAGLNAGTYIVRPLGGWWAECRCSSSELRRPGRLVVAWCPLHGQEPVDLNADGLCECCTDLKGNRAHTDPGCPVHDPDTELAGSAARVTENGADAEAAAHAAARDCCEWHATTDQVAAEDAAPRGMRFAGQDGQ